MAGFSIDLGTTGGNEIFGNFFVKVATEFVTMFMEWMLFAGCHSAE
jgi:hypothetical protein